MSMTRKGFLSGVSSSFAEDPDLIGDECLFSASADFAPPKEDKIPRASFDSELRTVELLARGASFKFPEFAEVF